MEEEGREEYSGEATPIPSRKPAQGIVIKENGSQVSKECNIQPLGKGKEKMVYRDSFSEEDNWEEETEEGVMQGRWNNGRLGSEGECSKSRCSNPHSDWRDLQGDLGGPMRWAERAILSLYRLLTRLGGIIQ